MDLQQEAATLITTIDGSFSKGYLFLTMKGMPLLTTQTVIEALVRDKEIQIIEPDREWSPVFHKSK